MKVIVAVVLYLVTRLIHTKITNIKITLVVTKK